MDKFDPKLLLLIFVELAVIYIFAAMLAAEGWVIYRYATGRPLLPARPLVARRPVPWGPWTVVLIVLMNVVVPLGAAFAYLAANGLLSSQSRAHLQTKAPQAHANDSHGKSKAPARPAPLDAKPSDRESAEAVNVQNAEKRGQGGPRTDGQPTEPRGGAPPRREPPFSLTESFAIQAVGSLVLLLLAPLILRMTSKAPLRDLGLSFEKWWQQVAVGVVAFLAIEPVLLAVQFGSTRVWKTNPHPLFKMVLSEFSPGVPQLAILTGVFIAPIWEELMFRGVIQSWLVSRNQRRRPDQIRVDAKDLDLPVPEISPNPFDGETNPGNLEPEFAGPADTALKPISKPPEPAQDRPPSVVLAILMTSLIFAGLHWEQWPAPIPLFVFSVIIGYIYQRTGSLIAAICMHAMFNALSTLILMGLLLVPQSAQDPNAKVPKPAGIVPGFLAHRDCACIHCKK